MVHFDPTLTQKAIASSCVAVTAARESLAMDTKGKMAESNGLTFLDVDGDDGVESLGRFLTEGMRCNAVVGGRACVRACDGHAVMQRVGYV